MEKLTKAKWEKHYGKAMLQALKGCPKDNLHTGHGPVIVLVTWFCALLSLNGHKSTDLWNKG